ncbi:MAG: tyrosine-type recombinase/integrase [Candidatus Brocadiales bacterium]
MSIINFKTAQKNILNKYISSLENRLAPSVYKNYTSFLITLPSDLGYDSIEHFFRERLKTITGKTANNNLTMLKGYLKWLRTQGYKISMEVLEMKQFRHVPTKFRRALTKEEIERLKEVSGHKWLWWSFLLHTGLRTSEYQALSWNDVVDGSIRIRDAKNPTKHHYLPLHKNILKTFKNPKYVDNLFKLPKDLLKPFKKNLRKAGISKEIDLHCLRVTFISALARAGVGPRTAQELVGHSDIQTTLKIYTKVTDQDKIDAVQRLKF